MNALNTNHAAPSGDVTTLERLAVHAERFPYDATTLDSAFIHPVEHMRETVLRPIHRVMTPNQKNGVMSGSKPLKSTRDCRLQDIRKDGTTVTLPMRVNVKSNQSYGHTRPMGGYVEDSVSGIVEATPETFPHVRHSGPRKARANRSDRRTKRDEGMRLAR